MGGAYFHVGEAVEGAFKYQVGEGERGFQGIADHIGERTAALHPLDDAGRLRRRLRMNEYQCLQLLGFFPERVEAWRGNLLAFDAAADGGADQTQLRHALFKLLGSEFGKLQRHWRVTQETLRRESAHFREFDTLHVEDASR